MKHGGLFSGIGGFDLASEWMGWENVFHCEWNEFGQRVLKHYWPKAISYEDITKTDFTIHRGKIDILTGGFPCQPYSTAGNRLGKEDDRHLWPEMLRAIREIKPRWVVGENVLGLTNWNGGLVFEEVQADLEAEGYEVQPFILPARAVNAPHKRHRVWFVAYSNSFGQLGDKEREEGQQRRERGTSFSKSNGDGSEGITTNANSERLQGGKIKGGFKESRQKRNKQFTGCVQSAWEKFPTQQPLCFGDDGFSSKLDGITFSDWRIESIKGGGNAIVPQVAHQIYKAIEEYEDQRKTM